MTKTIRNDYLESRSQNKTYTFYTGDLESFAKNILQNGRGNGTVCLLIEAAIRDPVHIYEDTMQKRLVYVCTHPYHTDKMVKVVVVPNFKEHGTVANRVKSWGLVEKNKMKMPQYKEIK
jgi:hypothetical protein